MITRALYLAAGIWCISYPFLSTTRVPAGSLSRGMVTQAIQHVAGARSGAQVRGHVVDAETGRPLHKARALLVSSDERAELAATTDEYGQYQISDVPTGRYEMTLYKDGYVTLHCSDTLPCDSGRPLDISEGQVVQHDVSLHRGGVISGRLFDDYGDPSPNVQIEALEQSTNLSQKHLTPRGRSVTDDLGEYRLYGLPLGEYYVSAWSGLNVGSSSDELNGQAYVVGYYPGTANPSEAQRLTVALGQILDNIDFKIVQTSTASIAGTVVDSKGRFVNSGFATAYPTAAPFLNWVDGPLGSDGTFSIEGLPPGEYLLRAQGSSLDGEQDLIKALVTVGERDITGLRLAPETPVNIFGRLVLDSQVVASVAPSEFRVTTTLAPIGAAMISLGRAKSSQVREDWTFDVSALSGQNVIGGSMPSGWGVQVITLNGVDISDAPIEVRPGQDVRNVEIRVTNHPARVSGTVSNRRGEIAVDYTAIMLPRDERRWRTASAILVARPDVNGRFDFSCFRPGDYFVFALEHLAPARLTDPVFLNQLRDRGTPFSLAEGETKILALKIFES